MTQRYKQPLGVRGNHRSRWWAILKPGWVTAMVTGSNVYGHPGSSWQLTATPSKRGSRVEMVWQRTFRRNSRGLTNLEALECKPSPHQMARRPSGTQSADQGC